jgi:hypothetical protein
MMSIVSVSTGPGLTEVTGLVLGPQSAMRAAGVPSSAHTALPLKNQVTAQAGDAGR